MYVALILTKPKEVKENMHNFVSYRKSKPGNKPTVTVTDAEGEVVIDEVITKFQVPLNFQLR